MKEISHTVRHGMWLIIAVAVGVGAAAFFVHAGEKAYSYAQPLREHEHTLGASDAFAALPDPDVEQYYVIGTPTDIDISAQSYLVADIKTGDILLSHGRKVVRPIASITKLMTAMVADGLSPEEEITRVSNRAVNTEGFRGGLVAGDEFTIGELVYPLLLVSSNDAAEAIAEHFDRSAFIQHMNTQARFLDMDATSFNDPSGLSQHNTATAADLFVLLQYIHDKHPSILELTQKKSVKAAGRYWENKNKMKNFEPYFAGGKTGYTNAAKQTGIGVFDVPLAGDIKRTVGIVILGSENRENDIAKLIRHMQKHLYYGDQETVDDTYREMNI